MFLFSKVVQGGMKWHFLWFLMLPIWYIFMSPIQISAIFQKNTGPLKMNTYFRKCCKYLPITSKNNHQNKFKFFFILYLQGLPKWANWCLTRSKENKISSLSSFPALKKPKEDIPPWLRLKSRKTFKLILLLPILG